MLRVGAGLLPDALEKLGHYHWLGLRRVSLWLEAAA